MTLVSTCALFAQDASSPNSRFEFFGGFSFNTDFVRDQPMLIVDNQKVSPFFSNGSGPFGFEASVKRYVRGGLGIKAMVSGYFDPFFEGSATYCQPTVCAPDVHAKDTPRTFYTMVGPEWKFRRDRRLSPFVFALGGLVYTRSTFELSGSNLQQANGFRSSGLIVINSAGLLANGAAQYSDASSDAGFALGAGGGFDTRLSKRLPASLTGLRSDVLGSACDYESGADSTDAERPVSARSHRSEFGIRVALANPHAEKFVGHHLRHIDV